MKKEIILKAEYGSDKTPLRLGTTEVPCYVLEDGTRVLSGRAIQKAIGYGGSSGDWLKKFVNTKAVSASIPAEIVAGLSEPIKFMRVDAGGSQPITYGYEATKLIDLCDALIDLNKAGVLKENQKIYAEQAEIIIRSVAKVGIIALVDEVTGYQQKREKDALQKFLEKFLQEEKGKWIKTYPDEFFEMIFKMKGLTWKTANKGQKPQWIGHHINDFVYSRIAPNVLVELRKLNPKNEKGNRKGKYPQYISTDFGHPKLKEHLAALIALGKGAGYNWNNFKRFLERAFPKFNKDGSQSVELGFPED
jgi:hypothetical protein